MCGTTTLPVALAIEKLREELKLTYGGDYELTVIGGGEVVAASNPADGDLVPDVEVRTPFVPLPNRMFAENLFLQTV